ncbi:MAG: hypothetical protein CMH86_11290 [Oceanibulbus sp.]|nr:hypothetical protein [Sulfitobacter sp.]
MYSRGIIESLSKTCNVTVICADSGAVRQHVPDIDWRIQGPQRTGSAGSVLSRWPLIAWKSATSDYLTAYKALLAEKWDAIVLDNLGLAHALPQAEAYRNANPGTKLIYISHEYEYPTRAAKYGAYKLSLAKRVMVERDLRKVKACEEALLARCDIVTVINTDDIVPFKKIAPEPKYLPLTPGYSGPVVANRNITIATPRRVLLLGGRRSTQKRQILMDWMEVSYARLDAAGIETVIVGDVEESLREQLRNTYPGVRVLGFVDDLGTLIASARIGLIADTVGGGFKMRLLSHVFERLPIVGLSDAINGLPTSDGEGYLGAPALESLVDLVMEVIDDPACLNALQNRAFADCLEAYSWHGRAENFASVIRGDTLGLLE